MASRTGSGSSPLHISEPSSVDVASEGGSVQVNEISDRRYPLWKYVKKIESNGPDGGNAVTECTFCGKQISGSYTRIRAHLLKISNQGVHICRQVTVPILEQLRKEVADAEAAISSSKPKSVPLPLQIGSTGLPRSEVQVPSQRKERGNQGLRKAFSMNVAKLLMLLLQECSTQEVQN